MINVKSFIILVNRFNKQNPDGFDLIQSQDVWNIHVNNLMFLCKLFDIPLRPLGREGISNSKQEDICVIEFSGVV